MLRVGLTGGLGSGKSTVLKMLGEHGAHVFSADELARALMQPGERVYEAIVERFGRAVVLPDGALDRRMLARLAFAEGRVEELNAIVHPATIARQNELAAQVFAEDPDAIVAVESALIFETRYGGEAAPGEGWRARFDVLVLVAAPDALKIARFVERSGGGDREALEAEARRRLAAMLPDAAKRPWCGYVIENAGTLEELRAQTARLWTWLKSLQHPQNS